MNHDLVPDRRHSLRQRVNTPAFASFDGVTGGMILDLSEEGMAMQSQAPIEAHSIVPLQTFARRANRVPRNHGLRGLGGRSAVPECGFQSYPTSRVSAFAIG